MTTSQLQLIGGHEHGRMLTDTGQQQQTCIETVNDRMEPHSYLRHPSRPLLLWDKLRVARTRHPNIKVSGQLFAIRGDLLYAHESETNLTIYNCENGKCIEVDRRSGKEAVILGPFVILQTFAKE